MMIWKQRAKLVMATARWVLKHPVYGIVILRLGIYTSRPNISKSCSFIGSTNPSILISVILENKLLASVSCFQKICLLSTNDLCFLTITCRPSRSFFLFLFCFIFYVCKNYTSITIYEKSFSLYTYIPIHDKLFLYTHALKTLSLYINTVYIKTLFLFKDFFFVFQHTLVVYTKISLYTLITHTQEFLFTPYLHTHKIFPYIFYI